MRPSKLQAYMDVAVAAASRSHDAQTKVGAVLVKNSSGAIIATGTNGFVRGAPDEDLPSTRPEKYEYIKHAEDNLIYNCARHGISMDDCMLVCTLTPCKSCMRALWQCGITDVIAMDTYSDFKTILEMRDLGIVVSKTEEGFWRLKYTQSENTTSHGSSRSYVR